jgi:hypothetical protein
MLRAPLQQLLMPIRSQKTLCVVVASCTSSSLLDILFVQLLSKEHTHKIAYVALLFAPICSIVTAHFRVFALAANCWCASVSDCMRCMQSSSVSSCQERF